MKNHGFTLLELIITIALAAILLGLAVPSMHSFIQNNRISGQANELIAALSLTRTEAIKRGREAWLCPSASTNTDNPTCGGSDWDGGWIAMVATTGPNVEVIRVWQPRDHQAEIIFDAPGGANDEVRYAANGMLKSPIGTGTCSNAICFDLEITNAGCRGGDDLGFRRIAIGNTGSTRMETRACSGD